MCIGCSPLGQALARAGVSRRSFLSGSGRLALGAAATGFGARFNCAAAQGPSDPSGAADAIFSGGTILTMDDARPTAEAVAVRGGRILAVGTRDEVNARRGAGTRSIDLAGRTMLPGFFDAHGHAVFVGLQAVSANLLPAPDGQGNDIAALQRLLREWMARSQPAIRRYGLIIGFGYDDSQLREQRHPTRDDLDQVSTDTPILIIHQSGHLGVVNSKALELAGITAATADPVGGVYRRRPGSREPDGVIEEIAFFSLLSKLGERFDLDAYLAMIRAGTEFYARFGYTTCQEARAFGDTVGRIAEAAERNLLPIDLLVYADIVAATDQIRAPALSREYRNRFRIGGAKLVIDGTPQGKTAWLTRPYYVPPPGQRGDYVGFPAIPSENAFAAVDRAFAEGWQIICHCNGDAASDVWIAAIREATRKHGRADRRPVLIHGQVLREDQMDALRALDILPSLFPMHTFYWGDWHRDSVLGPERAENISPTGWAMQRGMRFTSHHDAPVANPDSMRVLSATVTRRTRSGDILGPQHCVPVPVALKAMTIWAAHQHFEEDRKGSIEVGKLADFAVLSGNPLDVEPAALAGLKVVQTFKEGVSIFSA
ncbi:amidohydrolase [Roseomonas eburnea]|uniref:Amidohydrolase n=1 Tax=Neoroseomonas eburnea TaxID=1346889 RepID=A0A9X9XGZ0_9PROT|nr:amidohydrolase [Neoroseomonas eburnea]MBR0682976.1 amidohydrolase [Neoroseomonas eburnea]